MDPQTYRQAIELIKKLLRDKRPLSVGEIAHYLRVPIKRVLTIVDSYPSNFERYEDGKQTFVKPICRLTLCSLHCARHKVCNGSLPYCTGLHICKFYLLSGVCRFKQDCNFGHDLTIAHNMALLRDHNLHEVDISDIKYLLQLSENRTSMTIPKICKFYNVQQGCRYNETEGTPCPNLHICKHYVIDRCTFGRRCKRSHDMLNANIRNILQKHGINTSRTPKEILAELKAAVRDDASEGSSVDMGAMARWSSQPVVSQMKAMTINFSDSESDNSYDSAESAPNVNSRRRGRRGRRKKTGAPNYNAPAPFPNAAGAAPFYGGARPKTTGSKGAGGPRHDDRSLESMRSTGASGSQLLKRGISMEKLSSERICLFHLRNRCGFGQSCQNHHCDLPYQWQYKTVDTEAWENCDLTSQREIELSYCDAAVREHFLQFGNSLIRVAFDSNPMTGTDSHQTHFDIRRLSTPSSEEVEHQPLATNWVWHWRTQHGDWQEYGGKNMTGYKASITSEDIEQAYLSKPEGSLSFATQGHEYVLDFKKMQQRNLKYRTERAVCRRPVFVNAEEAAKRRNNFSGKGGKQGQGPAEGPVHMAVEVPSIWDVPRGTELIDYFEVTRIIKNYPATRKEYKEIETHFCESMPSTVSIRSIERIENGELWTNYVSKKARMKKKNSNQDVEERRLFHGTKVKYVDAISKQGFDFRLNGQTCGTMYGKGSYFATTSKYSDSYTDQSDRIMFVVKVLVGDYTPGKKKLVRPPSKDPSNACSDLFDSCVDKNASPSIFVIFDNNGQVYPEYLIKYEMKFE